MITGKYEVSLKTPMGLKKGELIINEADGIITGKMVVMGKENEIDPGKSDGNNFTFSGKLKTAMGVVPYTCEASVSGETVSGTVKTKKGDMSLTGNRKS